MGFLDCWDRVEGIFGGNIFCCVFDIEYIFGCGRLLR